MKQKQKTANKKLTSLKPIFEIFKSEQNEQFKLTANELRGHHTHTHIHSTHNNNNNNNRLSHARRH